MYTLIVKGDEAAAFAACRLHKVEITSIVKHHRFEECIVTIPCGLPTATTLHDWFAGSDTDTDGFYLPGSLMWFGYRRGLPVDNPPVPGWDLVEGGGETFHSRAAGADINLDKSVTGKGDQ
jgi:hypothetical protein